MAYVQYMCGRRTLTRNCFGRYWPRGSTSDLLFDYVSTLSRYTCAISIFWYNSPSSVSRSKIGLFYSETGQDVLLDKARRHSRQVFYRILCAYGCVMCWCVYVCMGYMRVLMETCMCVWMYVCMRACATGYRRVRVYGYMHMRTEPGHSNDSGCVSIPDAYAYLAPIIMRYNDNLGKVQLLICMQKQD